MYLFKRACQAILAFVFGMATMSHAQATSATVTGEITDSTGSVVSGASVSIANINTGIVSNAVTNNQGLYRVSGLEPGLYRVNVGKQGFKSIVKDSIELHVEDEVALNFSMEVGSVTESVTVEAGTPLIDTQSTSLGETIEGRQVEEAPLNGRNAMNLVALVPGVVPQGTSQGSASSNQGSGFVNPAGFGNYQIGGGIAGWNATMVDGANVNASGQNWQALIPTQDSVGEFRVDTNAVTPEYGRFAGGVINFSTKSGGNRFHGTAYDYLRNTIFDANTFFGNRLDAPRGVLHQNQFGATLGGPILRNKAFFFFSWESTRLLTASTGQYRSPTPAEMAGDFRADGDTFDIKTGAQADCNGVLNTFCANELDPTAEAMYKANYFAPVESDPAQLAILESHGYNGQYFAKQPNNATQYVARGDHQLSSKQRLFARYTYWNVDIPLPSAAASPAIPLGPVEFTTQQAVLGDNYTISQTMNADIRVAYTRFLYDVGTAGNGNYDLSQFGSAWAAVGAQLAFKAPPSFFPDFSWFGEPSTLNLQQHNHNDNYSISANFTKVQGRHSIQFGGEARRIEYYSVASIYPSGNFLFPGINATDSGIGNFVEGVTVYIPGFSEIDIASAPDAYSYYQGYYGTDTFQVSPKLTLNLGVRWELPGAWYERHDHDSVLLPNKANPLGSFANPVPGGPTNLLGEVVAVNSPDYKSRAQTQLHLHLFEPRVGANYSFDTKTVLRVGFGITHPCLDCGSVATEVSSSPFSSAVTLNTPGLGSLSNPYPNGINQPLGRSLDIMEPYSEFPRTLLGGTVSGQDPYQSYPYVAQWNLNVERSFGNSAAMMLSYSGARGVHLGTQDVNLNQLPDQFDSLGAKLLTQVANPLQGIATPTGSVGGATANYGQFLLPYPEFTQFISNGKYYGESSYNALSATMRKHFSAGATINASYSWAHLLTNVDSQNGYLEPGQSQTGFGPQDFTNPAADRSNSAADVRQRLTIEYILDLPFGKNKRYLSSANGVMDHIVSGWGLNGITVFQSGLPLGFTTNSGNTLSANFGTGTIRPNVVPGVSKKVTGGRYDRLGEWFNTAAFSQPGAFAFGNESRLDSDLRSDGIDNWDVNVSKTTAIKEGISLQFRAEFFNVFNHAQFAPPNTALGNSAFGTVTATANQPRIGQFSLRLNY